MTKKQIAAALRKAKKEMIDNFALAALVLAKPAGEDILAWPAYLAFVAASGAKFGQVGPWANAKTRRQVLAAFDRAIRAVEKPAPKKRAQARGGR